MSAPSGPADRAQGQSCIHVAKDESGTAAAPKAVGAPGAGVQAGGLPPAPAAEAGDELQKLQSIATQQPSGGAEGGEDHLGQLPDKREASS